MECSHCGGLVYLDEDPPADAGTDGDKVWCSEVCRQVVVDGKWPTSVGPASHEEILGWVAAQDREDAKRFDRRRQAEAAEKAKFDKAVEEAVARVLAEREG